MRSQVVYYFGVYIFINVYCIDCIDNGFYRGIFFYLDLGWSYKFRRVVIDI